MTHPVDTFGEQAFPRNVMTFPFIAQIFTIEADCKTKDLDFATESQ